MQTLKEVMPGEEITVSYDYALEDAPPWYQELYAQRIVDTYQKSKEFFWFFTTTVYIIFLQAYFYFKK